MDAPIQTTVDDALNHIQEWIVTGEQEKARTGLNEILQFDPNNEKAKTMLAEMDGIKQPKKTVSLLAVAVVCIVFIASAAIGFFSSKAIKGMFFAVKQPAVMQTTTTTNENLKGSFFSTKQPVSMTSTNDTSTNNAPTSATPVKVKRK